MYIFLQLIKQEDTFSSGKKLLGAPGLTTRSKDATNGAPGMATSNKKLNLLSIPRSSAARPSC